MSARLATGGRLIDRSRRIGFNFDGKRYTGHPGDTLASALLANGQLVMGRSFKYHRPRGPVGAGPEEPNALMGLGSGNRFEPNQRATVTELRADLESQSQNRWPSLKFDVGAINARLSKVFPAGFYYKTFLWPRAFWKHVYEPVIRHSAGLGRPPEGHDGDRYEQFHIHVDVLVVGGGVAGLAAALEAGRAGARVLLVEQDAQCGGRADIDGPEIAGRAAQDWVNSVLQELDEMKNVTIRTRCSGAGVYDHGYVLAQETLAERQDGDLRPRHRLWKIRARRIVTATGAIERPLSFAGNDIPGVMLAGAMRDFLMNWGVSIGDRTVLVTNNDDAYRTALALSDAGLVVPAVLDARPRADGALPNEVRARGIRVETGRGIAHVNGRFKVTGVAICAQAGEGAVLEEIACDAVAMSGGWSPVVHLWSHCGGKLVWDDARAMFRPDHGRPPTGADGSGFVIPSGLADGELTTSDVIRNAMTAGSKAAAECGHDREMAEAPDVSEPDEAPILPVWMMPQGAGIALREKMWLDFQNDVKVSDVELAAREGYESVEHAKRYTTLGMATDQGKLSNINGLAVLSAQLGSPIPQVGTTTFRPPWTPISMGAITGSATGALFQPVRRTPMQDWHDAQGADYEPVGHWRRPYSYPRDGESRHDAAMREVKNTRQALGLLDASTLGKIVVRGPDAGQFLDMIYTNMMSSLKVGRCRYGLICSENGFLMDDGVVARLDDDTWLCHTTTGGADRIHAHMEDWLQTEWWDWKVYTANLTEQYAQVAVVGSHARDLLQKLGGMDVSKEALPFMGWAEGKLSGYDARIFRISFSGELSFEVSVPASQGPALWNELVALGKEFGVMPYGTEAMHVLRAEKGFIMIGEETDGTVIPQDLNLDWAISKKKADYLGKRAQARSHMADPERWKLVGLETVDGSVLDEGAYVVAEGDNANGQRNTQGRVTSTYHSPTLGRGIAMALIHHGLDWMNEEVEVTRASGGTQTARIVEPVLYDPTGERMNG